MVKLALNTRSQSWLPQLEPAQQKELIKVVRQAPEPVHALEEFLRGQDAALGPVRTLGVVADILGDSEVAELASRLESGPVSKARATIAGLHQDIEALEASNAQKVKDAEALVEQIATRKAELKASSKKKAEAGLFALALGVPPKAVRVAGVMALSDDLKAQGLQKQLTKAREELGAGQDTLTRYQADKELAQTKLKRLEGAEAEIAQSLEVEAASVSRPFAAVASARAQLSRRERLLKNLGQQIEILKSIKNKASSLSESLGGLVEELEALHAHAQGLVDKSREELFDLLDIMMSDDPGKAATAWLDGAVSLAKKRAVGRLQMRVDEYIEHLVASVGRPDSPEAQVLRDGLKERLGAIFSGAPDPKAGVLNIADNVERLAPSGQRHAGDDTAALMQLSRAISQGKPIDAAVLAAMGLSADNPMVAAFLNRSADA